MCPKRQYLRSPNVYCTIYSPVSVIRIWYLPWFSSFSMLLNSSASTACILVYAFCILTTTWSWFYFWFITETNCSEITFCYLTFCPSFGLWVLLAGNLITLLGYFTTGVGDFYCIVSLEVFESLRFLPYELRATVWDCNFSTDRAYPGNATAVGVYSSYG